MINHELEEIKLRIKQAKPPMVFNGHTVCEKCKGYPEDYYVPTRGARWGSVCGGCQGAGVVERKIPAPQFMQLLRDAAWLVQQLEMSKTNSGMGLYILDSMRDAILSITDNISKTIGLPNICNQLDQAIGYDRQREKYYDK